MLACSGTLRRKGSVEEERVGGSVLCERRGNTREWVVLSHHNTREWVVLSHHHECRPAHASGAGATGGSGEARAPALQVMAWVELLDAQKPAATEWRLFRHVRELLLRVCLHPLMPNIVMS